jgi:2-dehydro-3-deoxyphosphogluconate aldolase/(4S)-4-hydroxy-2-oxoglutarate aldolase
VPPSFPSPLLDRLRRTGIVAVVVIDDPDHAEPLAQALLDGGIDLVELTLRTAGALESMRRIRRAFPDLALGAGTVLTAAQIAEVADAGCQFAVAPGLNPTVVMAARAAGLPFAPGVCTPSEIERAVELGCRLLKWFPAETLGGVRHLKAATAPYAHLGLEYIPLGGIAQTSADAWLRERNVIALGGSWIAPRELVAAGDWNRIRANARAAADLVKSVRANSPT